MTRRRPLAAACFFCLGGGLLVLNLLGMFCGERFFFRPPNMPDTFQKTQDIAQFDRQPGESVEAYLPRLAATTKQHLFHYFTDAAPGDPWSVVSARLVPPTENWLLYLRGLAGYLTGEKLYLEFDDPGATLRRGYGFCSQYALFIKNILKRNRMRSQAIAMCGHVITEAFVAPGKQWIIDADYNLVIPYSFEAIKNNVALIRPYYEQFVSSSASLDNLEQIYLGTRCLGEGGVDFTREQEHDLHHAPITSTFIAWSYWLKWIFPVACLLFGAFLMRKNGKYSVG